MYRVPFHGTGLCLASTAIQGPRAALLWLHRPTHQGCMTSNLSHLTEDTPMMNRKQSYIWRWYDLQNANGSDRGISVLHHPPQAMPHDAVDFLVIGLPE